MKKLFGLILIFGLVFHGFAQGADQWTKGNPTGLALSGTIDDNIRANNAAQDRLNNGYKRGLGVNYATASTLTVLPGEIAIPNAAVSTVQYRETTTNSSIDWSLLDTGSEENSTNYNLFATADTDITGMVFKISKSSAPAGSTYYRKIATFYNNASGNIESVLSLRNDDGTDYPDVVKAYVNFTGTGTPTINAQYNVSSITDNGTGHYTITFTTAFANVYYVTNIETLNASGGNGVNQIISQSTGSVTIKTLKNDGSAVDDFEQVQVTVIGSRV